MGRLPNIMMDNTIMLSFKNVSKRFGPVRALDNVSFDVRKGEVHCLVGENGAGKSTLMKILSGAYSIDGGSICINGEQVEIRNPAAAARLGISVVYQEMSTVDNLSIVDNIMLGVENAKAGFNDVKKNLAEVAPYLKQVDLDMDPHTILGTLKVAQKQMVMIAKALCKQARIIVLDEPTAMLNEKEVATLFDIIAKLKKQGITIIYISHRMEEIYKIGDHITVLKDGAYVGTYHVSEINIEELVVKMVGRELKDVYPTKNRKFGEPILEVKNLSNDRIHDISFTLRKGEVLGIAGLVGAGRTEILRAIFAADPKYQGTLVLKGREIDVSTPADSIRRGIGYLPEDKRLQGVINCLSVKDNITLIYSQLTANHGFLRKKDDDAITRRYMKELSIKASSPNQLVGELSGGNQQKVVISKWLSIAPNVILLDEPTQGIDVGTKAEIYQLIDNLAREGMGVVLVSSDLIEIINLSDRIIVMRDGRMAGELSDDEITEYNVMLYAMGVKKNEAI